MKSKGIYKAHNNQDNLPELGEIKDRELKTMLQRMNEKMKDEDIANQARETAKDIQKEIAPDKKFPPEQIWMPFCPMPTDMCRVSPFFPMQTQKLGERKFIQDMVITSSAWGEILYTGPKLSTYEEDALMAVLAILDDIKNRQISAVEEKKTYTYRGSLLPVLKLMGLSSGSANYKRVIKSLEMMTVAGVKLIIYKGSSKKGKRKLKESIMSNMLAVARWDDKKKELTVTVNPYFYECYIAGSITLLDVLHRSKMKSPIAKSLYRFIQSHRDNIWQGHYLTLASGLNLDRNQLDKTIKRYIKKAITELIQNKILSKDSGFIENKKDTIRLIRIVKIPHNIPKQIK